MTLPAFDFGEEPLDERAMDWACRGAGGGVEPMPEYREGALGFLVDELGVTRESLAWSENPGYETHEWDGDTDPFVQAMEALEGWQNVGIESATGTGKTFWLACITFWFLACWEDAIVVTAAPKEDQLLDKVWKEIERLWPRFERLYPDARLMDSGEIRMLGGASRTWKAKAEVTGVREGETSATRAQGEHAEHMLIITEETPGIHPAIMTAYENTRTAPHNLQVSVGNPDHQEDELHRFCAMDDVVNVRISALDYPNVVTGDASVVPGAVSSTAVRRRAKLYENMPAMYQSRVRGISPEQAAGVALRNFSEARNMEGNTRDAYRSMRTAQDWPVWCAVDMGHWRTAFVLGMVDRTGRMHVVEERFWHRITDETAWAREIHEALATYDAPRTTRIRTDQKSPFDAEELNDRLRQIDSPYRAYPVAQDAKARSASVRRLNWMLGEGKLLFRRGLGSGLSWRLGLTTSHQGEQHDGSRLLWEIKNWRYPEPREGRAQDQDPDDDTADGADAIAALRYMIMAWWKHADYEVPEEPEDPNRDDGLERLMGRLNREKERGRRRWP